MEGFLPTAVIAVTIPNRANLFCEGNSTRCRRKPKPKQKAYFTYFRRFAQRFPDERQSVRVGLNVGNFIAIIIRTNAAHTVKSPFCKILIITEFRSASVSVDHSERRPSIKSVSDI